MARPQNQNLIDNFETVVSSRWPTVQDIRAPWWSRILLKTLSAWRYFARIYAHPKELRWAQQFINLRKPKAESPNLAGFGSSRFFRAEQDALSAKAYRSASSVYDSEPNPMLSLEQRYVEHLLPHIEGVDVIDLGCGTGRWLERLALRSPRSLVGIDFSAEMLQVAKRKLAGNVRLTLADCESLSLYRASIDFILSSFVASYLDDLPSAAKQMRRILRPGGSILLTDVHPTTCASLSWRRGFTVDGKFTDIATTSRSVQEITNAFESLGLVAGVLVEPSFGSPELSIFARAGKLDSYKAAEGLPAIYILHLYLPHPRMTSRHETAVKSKRENSLTPSPGPPSPWPERSDLRQYRHLRPENRAYRPQRSARRAATIADKRALDLSGFLILPGLINAHDHLEFALFRLGKGPYRNFVEMGR